MKSWVLLITAKIRERAAYEKSSTFPLLTTHGFVETWGVVASNQTACTQHMSNFNKITTLIRLNIQCKLSLSTTAVSVLAYTMLQANWIHRLSSKLCSNHSRHHLVVSRHRRSTLGRRAFSVAGPMAWNALPDDLRDPSLSADNFQKTLKTHLFRNALGHLAH